MNIRIAYPIAIVSAIVVIIVWWWYCFQITTIVFVRHADRDGNNDALTVAGGLRAEELIHVAEKAGAVAIYHSGANRTRLTVTPLSNATGIGMTEIDDAQATVNHIFANFRGETVVVAGHSNTVPQMIEMSGGPPASGNLPSNEYDNLFVLSRCSCWFGPTATTNLQYGAVSP